MLRRNLIFSFLQKFLLSQDLDSSFILPLRDLTALVKGRNRRVLWIVGIVLQRKQVTFATFPCRMFLGTEEPERAYLVRLRANWLATSFFYLLHCLSIFGYVPEEWLFLESHLLSLSLCQEAVYWRTGSLSFQYLLEQIYFATFLFFFFFTPPYLYFFFFLSGEGLGRGTCPPSNKTGCVLSKLTFLFAGQSCITISSKRALTVVALMQTPLKILQALF